MSARAVVITVSDRSADGRRADASGPAAIEALPDLDASLVHREIVPDEVDRIRDAARRWLDRCDLLLLTGGTGVALRDVTPEAVEPLIQKLLPGFGEIMRMRAFERTPMSILSRGGAGVSGRTLVVWLPGSPKAVTECLHWLAPAIRHACAVLRGDARH